MRIAIVAVVKPIRGAVVDFHIAGPIGGANLHFRIEEIRAIMGIGEANVDYFNALAALRRQRTQGKEAMTPYVVKQLLHKGVHIWLICQRYGFWAGRTRYWLHFLASLAMKTARKGGKSEPTVVFMTPIGSFYCIKRGGKIDPENSE